METGEEVMNVSESETKKYARDDRPSTEGRLIPTTAFWESSDPEPLQPEPPERDPDAGYGQDPSPADTDTAAALSEDELPERRRPKAAPKIVARLFRVLLALLCLGLAVWLLLPAAFGIFRPEPLWPLLPLAAVFTTACFPQFVKRLFRAKLRWVTWLFTLCIGAGTLLSGVLMLWIWVAATLPAPADATVIVLGCQVNGSEPSTMLSARIDAACEYLQDNPSSRCVASGGQGENESISEAQCIYNELVRRGISPSRIYLEDKSTDSKENLANSAQVIRKNGLSEKVVIASDRFHQLRAGILASREGLDASPLGCSTWAPLRFYYWSREVPAVLECLVFG